MREERANGLQAPQAVLQCDGTLRQSQDITPGAAVDEVVKPLRDLAIGEIGERRIRVFE
jgi:hypothetical protein